MYRVWKILFKFYEYFLWLRTRVLLPQTEVTGLLLQFQSAAQQDARKKYRARSLRSPAVRPTKIALIVPFRDRWDLTSRFLDTLLDQSLAGLELMLVLVDNGSQEEQTSHGVQEVRARLEQHQIVVRVLRDDRPFNFSELNNAGVAASADFSPDVLCFFNNDIEFTNGLSKEGTEAFALQKIVDFAQTEENVGAVGCTLLYPDHKLQHLFLAPGVRVVGAHPYRRRLWNPHESWYQNPQPVAAVTGAAFAVKACDFAAVGGFDPALATANQDLDLCLKLQRLGRVNWVLPDVVLVHHESVTRKAHLSYREAALMYERWGDFLHFNAYYSSHLSRWSETPVLRFVEGRFPWKRGIPWR